MRDCVISENSRIGVLLPGGIGDTLFFLWFFNGFPEPWQHRFVFFINENSVGSLLEVFGIDAKQVINFGGNGYMRLSTIAKTLRYLRRINYTLDLVLLMPEVNRFFWKTFFYIAGVTKQVISTPIVPQHPIENIRVLLKHCHLPVEPRDFQIKLTAQEKVAEAEDFLDKYPVVIGVHTGSKPAKRWPIQYYREVVNHFSLRGKVGFMFFGSASEDFGEVISGPNVLKLFGMLNLKQLMHYIGRCSLFLSNDTGLMHIAALSGIKTIGLFGPTDWRLYYPYGERNTVLHANLPCQPCYKKRKFKCKDIPPACMLRHTPSTVTEILGSDLKFKV